MKKKLNQAIKKIKREQPDAPGRITNETVAEHRERILAGGRRFKYPIQYARVLLIRNTIIITILALAAFSGFTWWQLYSQQDTGGFFYRITQIVPLPVAKVDTQDVPYSFYLLTLRSGMYYKQTNENIDFNNTDGKRQLEYLKRTSLDRAVTYAYATELANKQHITVTDNEVDDFIKQIRASNKIGMDQKAFEISIYKFYGWSYDEFKTSTRAELLIQKVTQQIDTSARQRADKALARIKAGEDFAAVAKATSDDPAVQQSGGDIGAVPRDTQDPNGFVAEADKLSAGQVSGVITGTDGYYILKLVDKNDQQLHYLRIRIAFKEFSQELDALKKQGKVHEYISVPQNPGQ